MTSPRHNSSANSANKSGFANQFEHNVFFHLFFIILLPFLVYFNVIQFDFIQLDEIRIIKDNISFLSDISNIPNAFKTDAFLNTHGNSFYRPVQTISFMLDALVSNENPWMYHLTNLLLHISTCLVLYAVLVKIKINRSFAFAFSLLFSIHPLFSSAVSWIPARGDLIMSLSGMSAFLFLLKYFEKQKVYYLIIHFFLFITSLFSKETAVLFPVLFVMWLVIANRAVVKNNLKLLIPFPVIWTFSCTVYFIIRNKVMTGTMESDNVSLNNIMYNFQAIPTTFGKFFIPLNLSTLPLYDIVSLSTGCLLLAFCIFFILKNYKKNDPVLFLFGLCWFLIFSVPPLLYKITGAEYFATYFEHRTYLPSIGILFMMTSAIQKYCANDLLKTRFFYSALLVIVIFSAVAFANSGNYKNSVSFFSRAIEITPDNAGAYTNRGTYFLMIENFDAAFDDYTAAININSDPLAYFNRGNIYGQRRDFVNAENDFSKSVQLDPENANAFFQRANARVFLQKIPLAIEDMNKALHLEPANSIFLSKMGDIYFQTNKYDSAINEYQKVLTNEPGNVKVLINLARSYGISGHSDNSVIYFNKAISISPSNAECYYGRGLAKSQLKDETGACEDWNHALSLGFNNAKVLIEKNCK